MPNPYPARFTALLDALPPGSLALDLGAGGRTHPGVVPLDLDEGAVLGDCLRLPLRDDCADLILSQAVLEHVTDPDLAVREMLRVLRPGGTLYVEVAFMQPVHMAPHHYFNVTPHGLAWLLRDWEVLECGAIGTAREVLSRVSRAFGGAGCGSRARRVTAERYARASSGVYATARKPV